MLKNRLFLLNMSEMGSDINKWRKNGFMSTYGIITESNIIVRTVR